MDSWLKPGETIIAWDNVSGVSILVLMDSWLKQAWHVRPNAQNSQFQSLF